MSGDHTAENVKFEIEKIVNSYSKFNKTLANGKFFFFYKTKVFIII
jgi:hypothetical protein